jgi:exopolysaccharide production protein ExoY
MFLKDSEFFPPAAASSPPAPPPQQWQARRLRNLALACKRAVDIAGSLVILTLFLPVYVAVGLGVWLSSPGPVLFLQKRVGRDGRLFEFYKFRSMLSNPDEVLHRFLAQDEEARALWEAYQKLDNDPRVHRFGRFIRKYSLDELPQIWNVLKGDMSLVGPRPCLPGQKDYYGTRWAAYCAMKPGLTGLWQVSGRSRLTYAERVRFDGRYFHQWSLWLDAKILLKTVKVVLTGDGSV